MVAVLPKEDPTMTAFNAVRFRVKPGRDQEFLDAPAAVERNWPGMRHANIGLADFLVGFLLSLGHVRFLLIAERRR